FQQAAQGGRGFEQRSARKCQRSTNRFRLRSAVGQRRGRNCRFAVNVSLRRNAALFKCLQDELAMPIAEKAFIGLQQGGETDGITFAQLPDAFGRWGWVFAQKFPYEQQCLQQQKVGLAPSGWVT